MARQLSFAGVSFDVKDVKLSQGFIEMYDEAVRLVSNDSLHWFVRYFSSACFLNFAVFTYL